MEDGMTTDSYSFEVKLLAADKKSYVISTHPTFERAVRAAAEWNGSPHRVSKGKAYVEIVQRHVAPPTPREAGLTTSVKPKSTYADWRAALGGIRGATEIPITYVDPSRSGGALPALSVQELSKLGYGLWAADGIYHALCVPHRWVGLGCATQEEAYDTARAHYDERMKAVASGYEELTDLLVRCTCGAAATRPDETVVHHGNCPAARASLDSMTLEEAMIIHASNKSPSPSYIYPDQRAAYKHAERLVLNEAARLLGMFR